MKYFLRQLLAGITHAAVWAACCSFISHNTDAELRPSMQGFLQVRTMDLMQAFSLSSLFREYIMDLEGSAGPCSGEC